MQRRTLLRRTLLATLAAAIAVPLAGCGRRGLPIPPEDTVFPRTYPTVNHPDGSVSRPREEDDKKIVR